MGLFMFCGMHALWVRLGGCENKQISFDMSLQQSLSIFSFV